MPRFLVDMGSIVHSVDAASYHIKDGFVTFKNGDDVPIASFATIQVRKVELQGAVTETPNPHPPQVRAPGPGEWTTPGFGWERPALPPEISPGPSLPPVPQPLAPQSWERWTDVWRPAADPAGPPGLPSPVPGEQAAGVGFGDASLRPPPAAPAEDLPLPAPAEDLPLPAVAGPPPPGPEEQEEPGPADGGTEDASSTRDASTFDTGEWWIVDTPVAEADPHQWWIVDDSPRAMGGSQTPAPVSGDDAPASETPPNAGPDDEGTSRRAGTRSRDRRGRDAQHGWASSLASKRNRSGHTGSGAGDTAPVSHQLRARRVWAMEEADPAAEEPTAPPPAAAQEPPGNVVQFPRESHTEAVAEDIAPEARAQETPVSAVASGGSVGPEAMGRERKAPRGAPPEATGHESVAAETVAPESVSPDLKDLLDVAAVQAAVDAIVDAAVRGTSTGPDDDWSDP